MKTICECWDNTPIVMQEVIGGATARRLVKSANVHKMDPDNIISTVYNKGTPKSKSLAQRMAAKHYGNNGIQKFGRIAKMDSGRYMNELQKGGSALDQAISSRKPGHFANRTQKDKIKRRGKDLLDSIL